MRLGEKFVISAILNDDIKSLLKVPSAHFLPEELKLYKFVTNYFSDHAKLPEVSVCKDKFPDVEKISGSVSYYEEELLNRYIYTSLGDGLPKIVRSLKDDPQISLEKLRLLVSNLQLEQNLGEDMVYADSVAGRFKDYKSRVELDHGVTYISTGYDILDSYTTGIRKNDLWTLGGRSGTKKSWWLCETAFRCSERLPNTFGPALFVTNEMGLEEIGERFDAIQFKLNYERFISGKLSEAEFKRYKYGVKKSKSLRKKLVVIFNCSTLDELRFKIQLYNPSVVFLDGSYLLEPAMEEGMKKTTYITRNLKAIAKDTNTPIVNTTQLRKGTGKKASKDALSGQDQFFYGSYIHDSDFALAVYLEPAMLYRQEIGLDFVKGRRSKRFQLLYQSNLDTMNFGYTVDAPREDDYDITDV